MGMWRGPQENVTYEFIFTSPAVSSVSCLSYLDSFRDGGLVAVQLLFCGMLLPGFVPYSLVQFLSSLFSIRLVSVHVVHPYNRIDRTAVWKKLRFILLDRSDFHMNDNLLIAVHAFPSRILMPFSVDETLLPRYMNLATDFREPPFSMELSYFWVKHMFSVFSAFTWRPMSPAACSRLCSRDLAWVGVFARNTMSSA